MNCRCDEQLAHSLKTLAPTVYNDDFQDFDHVNECKASSNTGSGASNGSGSGSENNLECCGTYPNRFEFLTQGGTRSCCWTITGYVTYNPNHNDCCDGSLRDLGTCDL